MEAKGRSGRRSQKAGFSLIAAAFSSFAVIGATGLAVDIGRMFIAKNEVQAFTDAAAIAAVQELDGTQNGIARATAAARAVTNRWNLSTQLVTDVTVEFSRPDPAGGLNFTWVTSPLPATGYTTARVRARVPVPLYFIAALAGRERSEVGASSVGAQWPVTSFKQGLFPFSPFGHLFELGTAPPPCGLNLTQNCRDPITGLIVGQQYTLRWPSNPSLGNGMGNNSNMCPGDRISGQPILTIANSAGSENRGFIEETAASVARQTVINDYQSIERGIGDLVDMEGGAMQTIYDALQARILQDLNTTATNSQAYYAGPHNGRRIVGCLINDGVVQNGDEFRAIQIGAFLLLPGSSYGTGGNQSWCGEYLGAFCQGCKGRAAGISGGFVVRLLQ